MRIHATNTTSHLPSSLVTSVSALRDSQLARTCWRTDCLSCPSKVVKDGRSLPLRKAPIVSVGTSKREYRDVYVSLCTRRLDLMPWGRSFCSPADEEENPKPEISYTKPNQQMDSKAMDLPGDVLARD